MTRAFALAVGAGALLAAACSSPAPIQGAPCDDKHPCPGGYTCNLGACKRLQGDPTPSCTSDAECGVGVCRADGVCVQCVVDADCPGIGCRESLNVCGCEQHADCDTNLCKLDKHYCTGCSADEQCESGTCDLDDGSCVAPGGGDGYP